MAENAPGDHYREGMRLVDLMQEFPDKASATKWFGSMLWKDGGKCPFCGSGHTVECSRSHPLPDRCYPCKQHFTVRCGTVMEWSKVPLQK